MHLNSVNNVYNSVVDSPIYQALGCSTNAQKMLCFLLDERTRELLIVFLFPMMKNKLCKILDINVDYK